MTEEAKGKAASLGKREKDVFVGVFRVA